MTDHSVDPVPDPPDLEPGALASTEFARARKGFEPTEVRALLGRAADALRAWKARDDRLSARVDDLERRLEQSQELDEERITAVLGEETARIVAAAREAAAEIRTKAKDEAERLVKEADESASASAAALTDEASALRDQAAAVRDEAVAAAEETRAEAQEHADRLRAEASAEHDSLLAKAKTVLDERTAEAEAVAGGIREAAQIELDAARGEGVRLRDEARTAAAAEVERSRSEGRAMVDEARHLRRQMLEDLAERRRTARRQIEAARAGRDRIVETLTSAGERVAEVVAELDTADELAQLAADDAAAAVDDDVDAVVAELEEGLTLGGLPLDEVVEGSSDSLTVPTADPSVPPDAPSDAVPEPAGAAEDTPDTSTEDVAVLDESADDEPSPGATVHDLFERIRAERRGDADSDDHPAGSSTELDGEPGDEVASIDIDLEADDAVAAAEPTGGPELASVVVLEQPDPAADAAAVVDVDGDADVHGDADVAAEAVAVEEVVVEEVVATSVGGSTVIETTAVEVTAVRSGVADGDEPSSDAVEAATSALDRRDELLGPAEKSLVRTLKRLVSDEQNEVLDRLRRIRRGRPDLDALLPAGEDQSTFNSALHDDFAAAAAAGVAFWTAEVDGDAASEVADPDVVQGGLEVRVAELLDLRRLHVQRALDHAEAEGVELADLGDRVRAAYREWRTRTVPELAGDLAAAAFALGEQAAAGPDTLWCWMVDNGGLACSDAEDNALAGATACGAVFPTGDVIPPAHSGCRCILVPPHR